MTLSPTDRSKTQKLVDRLENGEFDDNDVDALLIKLRDHCGKFATVREAANWVAHSEKGYAGLVRDNLRRMHFRMKHFQEYVMQKKSVDFGSAFPSYVFDLMKYEIDYCNGEELLQSFGVSSKSLKNKLDRLFRYDKKNKLRVPVRPIPSRTGDAIRHLLGYIRSAPAFGGEELVNQLIEVLNQNGLIFDESRLLNSGDRIVLCILMLLHNRLHKYESEKRGRCTITSETTAFPTGKSAFALDRIDKHHFGKLAVCGTILTGTDEKITYVSFPVFTTALHVADWVDDSLFTLDDIADEMVEEHDHWYVWKFDADADLYIDQNFRISRLVTR